MGMFDTVRVNGLDLQTKDWDCSLDIYVILDDNTVMRLDYEGDAKPLGPYMPHGWIYAYTDGRDYRIKFTDGKLIRIEPDNEAAKQFESQRAAVSARGEQNG